MANEKAETPMPVAMLMLTGILIVSPTQVEAELDWYCPMVVAMLWVVWALTGFIQHQIVPRIKTPRRLRMIEKSKQENFSIVHRGLTKLDN